MPVSIQPEQQDFWGIVRNSFARLVSLTSISLALRRAIYSWRTSRNSTGEPYRIICYWLSDRLQRIDVRGCFGGLVGYNEEGTVLRSHASASVSGYGDQTIGDGYYGHPIWGVVDGGGLVGGMMNHSTILRNRECHRNRSRLSLYRIPWGTRRSKQWYD